MVYIGTQTVPTPGTRVSLAALDANGKPIRTPAAWVVIVANTASIGGAVTANVKTIFLGDKTVSSANGQLLQPGGSFTYPPVADLNMYNLAEIYIDAENANDAVRFVYGRH